MLKTLLFPLFFILAFSSCSKTTLRSITYYFDSFEFSGVTTTLKVTENSDKNSITISSDIKGLTNGKIYSSFIYAGEVQKTGSILFNYDKFSATNGTYSSSIKMLLTYEEYLAWDASYLIHHPDDQTKFVLKGNLGINNKQ